MIKSTYRPKSPFTYFTEHNRRVATETEYPATNHDTMLKWKLSFQRINKLVIPKVIADRHKHQRQHTSAHDAETTESADDIQPSARQVVEVDTFIEQNQKLQRQYIGQLKPNPPRFIDNHQRKTFSVSKFQTSQLLGRAAQDVNVGCLSRQNVSLTKVLSSIPLHKLEDVYRQKQEGVVELIDQKGQLANKSTTSRRYLHPVYNTKLSQPLGKFLALVQGTERNFRSKKRKGLSTGMTNRNIQLDFEPQQSQEVDEDHGSIPGLGFSRQLSNTNFRMREPGEIDFSSRQPAAQAPRKSATLERKSILSLRPSTLKEKVDSVFQNKGFTSPQSIQMIFTIEVVEKRYFYNFKKYFYSNYASSKEFNPKLSKGVVTNLNQFEDRIAEYMQHRYKTSHE